MLMGRMRVLMAVSAESLRSPWDLRAPDGSSVNAHVTLVSGLLALPDASIAQEQLALGVRCMADLLLSTARLLVQVRAPQRGASPLPLSLPGCHCAVLDRQVVETCIAGTSSPCFAPQSLHACTHAMGCAASRSHCAIVRGCKSEGVAASRSRFISQWLTLLAAELNTGACSVVLHQVVCTLLLVTGTVADLRACLYFLCIFCSF